MFDVAVIGGGLAGLSAATRAAEAGVKVVLIEQGDGEAYPCNSRYSAGVLHIARHDPEMPADELVASLRRQADPALDFSLVETVARNAPRAIEWLRLNGKARFERTSPAVHNRLVLAPPRPKKTRLVWPEKGPDITLRNLRRRAQDLGVTFQMGTVATGALRMASGFTVTATCGEKAAGAAARTVIVADGGFQADPELLHRHIAPDVGAIFQRNAETGRGFGVRLASQVGARLSHMGCFYGHLLSSDARTNPELTPYPNVDPLAQASIIVGTDGMRFCDEGRGGIYIANAVSHRENARDVFVIFDETAWQQAGRQNPVPPNPTLVECHATVLTAGTIRELARAVGIDATALQQTVERYNDALATGTTVKLDPPRDAARIRAYPVATPPFYAVPVCAGITYTMGGLVIDGETRIQSERGGPINGLFAAGSCVGNIDGGDNATYWGGLCRALTLGVLSGEAAAARAQAIT